MVEKFATGVADTSGKFTTGVIDTGGNFAASVVDTSGKFQKSLRLQKIRRIYRILVSTENQADLQNPCVYRKSGGR